MVFVQVQLAKIDIGERNHLPVAPLDTSFIPGAPINKGGIQIATQGNFIDNRVAEVHTKGHRCTAHGTGYGIEQQRIDQG